MIISKRFYSRAGKLTKEISYEKELPVKRSLFKYNALGNLVLAKVFDGQDKFLYTEEYAYTSDDLLREVIRILPDEKYEISSFNFGNKSLVEQRDFRKDDIFISRFDESGRLIMSEIWQDNKLVNRIEQKYNLQTGIILLAIEDNFISNTRFTSMFDENGRLTRKAHQETR